MTDEPLDGPDSVRPLGDPGPDDFRALVEGRMDSATYVRRLRRRVDMAYLYGWQPVMTEFDVTPPHQVVYGVSKRHSDPNADRRFLVPRYYGWVVDLLQNTSYVSGPRVFRDVALHEAKRYAQNFWDKDAKPASSAVAPPSGYGDD